MTRQGVRGRDVIPYPGYRLFYFDDSGNLNANRQIFFEVEFMYTIGKVADITGCSMETIRYYEKINLIRKAQRSMGGHRLYSPASLNVLQFVVKARNIGFSLAEVKELMSLAEDDANECDNVFDITDRHLLAITEKITRLERARDELIALTKGCKSCCAGKSKAADCNIISALSRPVELLEKKLAHGCQTKCES